MTRLDRQLLWYSRIQAFQNSGETSVAAWCAKQDVPVQSMYHWLKKTRLITSPQPAQWLSVAIQESVTSDTVQIVLKIKGISIELPSDFEEATLTKILHVVHNHVH